ncbi:hypothetical protein POM88_003824 [Heracleum sosnowskyi]|uniref:ATP-dependent DNA helicase n=1 Tax=Heracleum sosnowskyi TaxID=360622 RepID=A0AAD8JIP7_9APIA|nr:hypothetical protein POM88_003824 [Heracleum sosnowskyi]
MAPPGRKRGRPRLGVLSFVTASQAQNQEAAATSATPTSSTATPSLSHNTGDVVHAEAASRKRQNQAGETLTRGRRLLVSVNGYLSSCRYKIPLLTRLHFTAASTTILNIGDCSETCGCCHAKVWPYEFTGRYTGHGPKGYSICCGKGKIQLPLLQETPQELSNLLGAGGVRGRMFENKKLIYNNMFSFTSFGGNIDHSLNNGSGPFVFRVRGHTCHSIGSLKPPDGCEPKFAQLYMYDGQEEIEKRLQFPRGNDIDVSIVEDLSRMLERDNALVKIYRQVRERFRGVQQTDVRLRLLERRTTDGRFVNIPNRNDYEFAGLVLDNDFLDMMLSDLTKKDALGRVRAVVYTVEFQKWGLPHAHIVLWLAIGDKLTTPADIDTMVCAEIPDKETDVVGYNAVSQFMMHGPCAEANPRCPCMQNNVCTKFYPKIFTNVTHVAVDGYAAYRRRDTGRTMEVNKIYLDNRHVVPYNRVAGIALPFRDWVLSVGDGTKKTFDLKHDGDDSWIHIPKELQVSYDGDPVCAIVNEIYDGLDAKHGDIAYLRDRAILTPLNEYVEVINQEVLGRLPGKSKSYTSCDTICKGSTTSDAAETLYPTEYLNSLRFSGMPNHKIQLKIGAPIMLLRNLNPKKGLCNGTRLIVTRCYPFLIEAFIITGASVSRILNLNFTSFFYLPMMTTELP